MNLIDDDTLLMMAEAEILGEAKRAAVRHSVAGISGWQPCPKPNKVFLANTLLHTMASNRLLSRKSEKRETSSKPKKSERKLLQKSSKNEKTNFIYKKPEKNKQKQTKVMTNSSKSGKCDKDDIKLKDKRYCREISKVNEKCKPKQKLNKK